MKLYDDPIAAYDEIVATLQPGQKFVQESFDYETYVPKRIEEIIPDAPLFDADGANSYEAGQGGFGNCGTIAELCGIAEAKNKYTIEDCIYPHTVSPHGLYLVSYAVGLTRKWVAIDSNVATYPADFKNWWMRGTIVGVKPVSLKPALWAAIMEKAAASLSAVPKYSTLEKSRFDNWFPYIEIKATTFNDVKEAIDCGGYFLFSYKQPIDATGAKISVPGIVTGHAFAVVDAIAADGLNLVRIENPWGGGTDYASPVVADNSPFWDTHPELAEKVAATRTVDGAYWLTYEEWQVLTGVNTPNCKIILSWNKYPHAKTFQYVFDDTYQTTGGKDWPALYELRKTAVAKQDKIVFKCAEQANVHIKTKWLPNSTGSRHSYVHIALDTDSDRAASKIPVVYGWWAANCIMTGTLQPNLEYNIYPATVSETTDRGAMEIYIFSDKPYTLLRNGVEIL